MPMLVWLQRLFEPAPFFEGLPFHFSQQSRAT
jgi:hypothetical protein